MAFLQRQLLDGTIWLLFAECFSLHRPLVRPTATERCLSALKEGLPAQSDGSSSVFEILVTLKAGGSGDIGHSRC